MPNWRDSIPSKWLKAGDLEGKPHLVTIKRFSVEEIGDGKKPVVWFREQEKRLGLNITNGKKIETICGSADPANWVGKRVVIFPTETEFKGETVDCIRVRAPKAGAKLPPLLPEPEPDLNEPDGEEPPYHDDSDAPF
jgi:hypothetical protein